MNVRSTFPRKAEQVGSAKKEKEQEKKTHKRKRRQEAYSNHHLKQ